MLKHTPTKSSTSLISFNKLDSYFLFLKFKGPMQRFPSYVSKLCSQQSHLCSMNVKSVKCLNFGLICYWFIPILHFHSWLPSVALGYTRSKPPADFIKNDMGCETTILPLISFTQMKYFSSCETYLFLFLHFIHFSQIYLMPNSKTVLTALLVTQFTQFSFCLCP